MEDLNPLSAQRHECGERLRQAVFMLGHVGAKPGLAERDPEEEDVREFRVVLVGEFAKELFRGIVGLHGRQMFERHVTDNDGMLDEGKLILRMRAESLEILLEARQRFSEVAGQRLREVKLGGTQTARIVARPGLEQALGEGRNVVKNGRESLEKLAIKPGDNPAELTEAPVHAQEEVAEGPEGTQAVFVIADGRQKAWMSSSVQAGGVSHGGAHAGASSDG